MICKTYSFSKNAYNHKRAMLVLMFLAMVLTGFYFYINQPRYFIIGRHSYSIPLKDMNDNFIYVSEALIKDTYIIRLNFKNESNSCMIDPKLTFSAISEFDAYSLSDNRILVRLKNDLLSIWNLNTVPQSTEWRIILIDPKNCFHHDLKFIKKNNLERLVNILPYNDTFDVIMEYSEGSHSKVNITRFDSETQEIKNFPETVHEEKLGKIHMIKATDEYYYIGHNADKTYSILTKLNDEFEKIENSFKFSHGKYYDEVIYSIKYGRIWVCFFNDEERKNLTCQMIDVGSNKTLDTAYILNEDQIYFVTVTNLPEGGIIIVFAKQNQDKSFSIYVQRVIGEGKFEKPVKIGEAKKELQRIYLFERKNGSKVIATSSVDSVMPDLIELNETYI